jgi:hypothetical protein
MVRQLPFYHGINLGCDPEIFLSKKVRGRDSIVPSDAIIPREGLKCGMGQIVQDGIQVEIHPIATPCRANTSNYLQACFRILDARIKEADKQPGLETLKADFRQVIKLTKGEMSRLLPSQKELGCMPSLNAYGRKHIQKDGSKYMIRSAAGHIHIGTDMFVSNDHGVYDTAHVVRILDVLVGNTAVMIDMDPLAAERRKVYGRAGEYRLPKHGLEYRTLSNFWLQDYKLMSLMFGLVKFALKVAQSKNTKRMMSFNTGRPYEGHDFDSDLMSRVDLTLIEKAINTNDPILARSNYEQWVRPFIAGIECEHGLSHDTLGEMDYFLDTIKEQGLLKWFSGDPLKHWVTKPEGHETGWESFLKGQVRVELGQHLRSKVVMPDMKGLVVEVPPARGIDYTAPVVGPDVVIGANIIVEAA